MHKIIPSLVLVIFLFGNACTPKTAQKAATSTPLTLGKNVLIHQGKSGIGPCEPSICISPTDNNKIVAGSVLDNVYYSEDGGKTWVVERLDSPFGVYGDPVIGADSKGDFYYLHLSDPDKRGWSSERILDRIVIQKSKDGGKTWSDGSFMGLRPPKDQDKHWLGINPDNDDLYVTWTEFDKYGSKNDEDKSRILFSKSVDGGINWTEAIAISEKEGNCIDDDQTPEGAIPVAGLDGEIFVTWAFDEKLYFDCSLDGGKTWLDKDVVAATQPGGWTIDIPGLSRANGMPVLSIDRSNSKNRGTLYLNWSDQRNGESDTDIWFAKSTDKGITWSTPKRVNDDNSKKQQFYAWMDCDPTTGNIYIIFYDRRAYNDNQTDVYLAYSTDGGNTFTNKKISDSPFIPTEERVFFGDYNNISAKNNHVRPIWTRCDKGVLSIWTSLIEF